MKSVLIVEEDDARRKAIADAFAARSVPFLDVQGIFPAMAAFGRADFGAVLVAEGAQNRSVRGLCGMARRYHEGVRLFVVANADADRGALKKAVGDDVVLFDRDDPLDAVVDAVAEAMAGWPAVPQGDLAAVAAPAEPAAAARPPLTVEGVLAGEDGAALLIGLFAQGLTGRLTLESGAAAGTLFLHKGEPAWAEEQGGDQTLHALLVQRSLLPADFEVAPQPEGALLEALYQQGRLTQAAVTTLVRGLVRERVLAVAQQGEGAWHFVEDATLAEPAPPFTVNPFGLVLESLRRSMAPDRLLVVAGELEQKYMLPEPALSTLSGKVAGFLRGLVASTLIDGTTTVKDFTEKTGLDMLMGSLVVLTLLRSKMVALRDVPEDPRGQLQLRDAG